MDSPTLPQDALDLLAIGRRYYDVVVEWVPKGDPRCYGRAFGFWCVEAGPPGWESRRKEIQRLSLPVPATPDRSEGPASCEWIEPRETIRKALTMARQQWPECCQRHGYVPQ
jgi:hypothetical protein